MKQILLVFLGGGVGSCLRYIITRTSNNFFHNFYFGTFFVNIIGCLIIGFILGASLRSNYLNQNHYLLLATGFCGGFTTFSAFAAENHALLKAGDIFHFSIYALGSVLVGILAVALGLWLSKLV